MRVGNSGAQLRVFTSMREEPLHGVKIVHLRGDVGVGK
jgi:hypothetical protein